MIDLSAVQTAIRLTQISVTRRRPAPGFYNEQGLYVEAAPVDTTIKGTFYEMDMLSGKPREILSQISGVEQLEVRAFWTMADLVPENDIAGTRGDRIIAQGQEYRVLLLQDRYEAGFRRAILGRQDERGRRVRYNGAP